MWAVLEPIHPRTRQHELLAALIREKRENLVYARENGLNSSLKNWGVLVLREAYPAAGDNCRNLSPPNSWHALRNYSSAINNNNTLDNFIIINARFSDSLERFQNNWGINGWSTKNKLMSSTAQCYNVLRQHGVLESSCNLFPPGTEHVYS